MVPPKLLLKSDTHLLAHILLAKKVLCLSLMAKGKEELKNLLMKVKEESEKAGPKFEIQKAKIMASGPITSWQIERKQRKQ